MPGSVASHAQLAKILSPSEWAYITGLPFAISLPALETLVVHAGIVPGVPLLCQDPTLLLNIRYLSPGDKIQNKKRHVAMEAMKDSKCAQIELIGGSVDPNSTVETWVGHTKKPNAPHQNNTNTSQVAEYWGKLYAGPTHIVFGHDAAAGLQIHPHATGIDTGAVYGKKLSALVFECPCHVSNLATRPKRDVERVPVDPSYVSPTKTYHPLNPVLVQVPSGKGYAPIIDKSNR